MVVCIKKDHRYETSEGLLLHAEGVQRDEVSSHIDISAMEYHDQILATWVASIQPNRLFTNWSITGRVADRVGGLLSSKSSSK